MTALDHVVEATAEEIGTDLDIPADHAPIPAGLFGTDDPVAVIQRASVAATALADVISDRKLFTNVQGKSHVHVEGWTLMGAMLGVTAVCVATEVVDGGYKATVEARSLDGRVVGRAEALCTKYEKRGPWKTADDHARLSMAQTRATSKALKGPLGFVISLAGYATTPAEEMTFAAPDEAPPTTPAEVPVSEPLLSDAELAELATAAKGLKWAGIKLILASEGIDAPALARDAFSTVTTAQYAGLHEALTNAPREASA